MSFIKSIVKLFTGAKNSENEDDFLDIDLKTHEDIEKLFRVKGLEKYTEKIKPFVRPKVDLITQPVSEDQLKTGQSKIGGQPDLVDASSWPADVNAKPMSFIAQINCSDLNLQDAGLRLPSNGLISFFFCADQDVWGFSPEDKSQFKVLFTTHKDLKRIDFPDGLEQEAIFTPNSIEFSNSLSLPNWEYDFVEDIIDEKDFDNYCDISGTSENQMFGYADPIQSLMELDCQLVTNGIYIGDTDGYQLQLAKELENGKTDWILLLQVDSEDDKTGMMWGDSGKLYFWIRKQDLAIQNFDNCWCILQCS